MSNRFFDDISSVPYIGDNDYNEFEQLVREKIGVLNLSSNELERVESELEFIKDLGISRVFLFAMQAIKNLEGKCACIAYENTLFINYVLGLTKVNSVEYNLPKERFSNKYRRFVPNFYFHVKKGYKSQVLNNLYYKYGKNHFARGYDNTATYFYMSENVQLSNKLKESIIVAKLGEESYQENISNLTEKELYILGNYSFDIVEVDNFDFTTKHFSEEEIYQKAKELILERLPAVTSFTEIDEVNDLLKNTNGKLIYQEQYMEILNKICGFDMEKADFIRRETAKAKRDSLKELKNLLINKYGKKGEKFFEYLFETVRYSILKSYILAELHCGLVLPK